MRLLRGQRRYPYRFWRQAEFERRIWSTLPVVNIGLVTDEAKLAEVYAAADVFVAPAAEDNLPNTVLEAMACGTPVVAFAAGGIPDAVQHMENGFLASPQAGAELGAGIGWVLADEARLSQLRVAARTFAEARFDYRIVPRATWTSSLKSQNLECNGCEHSRPLYWLIGAQHTIGLQGAFTYMENGQLFGKQVDAMAIAYRTNPHGTEHDDERDNRFPQYRISIAAAYQNRRQTPTPF